MRDARADLDKMFPAEEARCEVCGKWLKIKELLAAEAAGHRDLTICRECLAEIEPRFIRLR